MSLEIDSYSLLPSPETSLKEVADFYAAGAALHEQTVPAHTDGLDLDRVERFMGGFRFARSSVVVTTVDDYEAVAPQLRQFPGLDQSGARSLGWSIPSYRAGVVYRDVMRDSTSEPDAIAIESVVVHEQTHVGVRELLLENFDFGGRVGVRQLERQQGFRRIIATEDGQEIRGLYLEEARASYYQQLYRETYDAQLRSTSPLFIVTPLGRLAVPRGLVFDVDTAALQSSAMLPLEDASEQTVVRISNVPGIALRALCAASPRLRRVMGAGMNSFKPRRVRAFIDGVNDVDAGLYNKIKDENLGIIDAVAALTHDLVDRAHFKMGNT